jgi:2-polyprenyl-3-methyl-5-hydroxy-6-metoxy-1,4-benzoquinol methylase
LTQQIREPLEEETDRKDIPALTPIDDAVSLQVQHQYEESPYPRWTAIPQIEPTTVVHFLRDRLNIVPLSWPQSTAGVDILIAGCGTGSHSIDSALRFPKARILAIDISRASLAYARRKSRALGLTNIEYGQADILKLASLGRRFDVIETVGVLHHLADPAAGWRVLLSLLRPHGLMLVGLYSATARQSLAAARALITERGYHATADDIRACRQELIRRSGMPPFRDFSSTSGCRDLLFNVMEHQFTIPQIKAFLDENRLTFLGFEQLPPDVLRQFQQQFPDTGAMRDLGSWHAFEQANPLTFGNMYFFWVQKTEPN